MLVGFCCTCTTIVVVHSCFVTLSSQGVDCKQLLGIMGGFLILSSTFMGFFYSYIKTFPHVMQSLPILINRIKPTLTRGGYPPK